MLGDRIGSRGARCKVDVTGGSIDAYSAGAV